MGLAALGLIVATYFTILALVLVSRPRPLALAAPLALTVVLCFESALLQTLSLVRGVTTPGMVGAHAVLLALILAVGGRRLRAILLGTPRRARRAAMVLGGPGLLLLPVLVLLVLSAARYAPGTWDSMTYHLARVAHWIQNASVAPYPTSIPRQWAYGPGAEYLLLFPQVIASSDRLANFLQLACWAILVVAAVPLARLAGAPAAASRWAAVLTGTAPMAILQGSSTQNDLVSAAVSLAMVIAVTPFLRRPPERYQVADVMLLAAAGAAGVLVKSTTILVTAPVLAVAAWSVIVSFRERTDRLRIAVAWLGSAAACVLVAGQTLIRASDGFSALAPFLYPLWGDWGDRSLNILRGVAHHVPLPRSVVEAIGASGAVCDQGAWCFNLLAFPHEDFAGNAASTFVLFLLGVVAAIRWGRLPRRSREAVLLLPAAWVLFHLFVRDNAWVSRLHLPLFALTPIAMAALAGARLEARSVLGLTVLVGGLGLVAQGAWFGWSNESRPPLATPVWAERRDWGYYVNRPDVMRGHDRALEVSRATGCRRIGLMIGGDSYDYPLTWRAMQRQLEVRHVLEGDPWPCVLLTENGPPGTSASQSWIPTESPSVFYRAVDSR